jgi:hypothetical protein
MQFSHAILDSDIRPVKDCLTQTEGPPACQAASFKKLLPVFVPCKRSRSKDDEHYGIKSKVNEDQILKA